MTLVPLTTRSALRAGTMKMLGRLKSGAKRYRRVLGFPSESFQTTFYWHSQHGFWSAPEPDRLVNRYWTAFGTSDPSEDRTHTLICELNSPREGINRRTAGVLLRDASGRFIVAHSGKIGGGRKGVGRQAFLDHFQGDLTEVEWPDGRVTEVAVIDAVDSPRFLSNLGDFVREIERIKRIVVDGTTDPSDPSTAIRAFTPEFHGTRREYRRTGTVRSTVDHGRIVNQLCEELAARRKKIGKTQQIDLAVLGRHGRLLVLFEVKPETTTTHIYQAVGQVMLHGANQETPPRRVIVVPNRPTGKTAAAMRRLDIEVLTFRRRGKSVTFDNLDAVLKGRRAHP